MSITIGARIGSYEILSLIGKGGMGEVYRARDSKLKRDVAIKVLPGAFSNDLDRVSRFQREAQVLAALNHSNIAHIYGLEETNQTSCIVMELVEGGTLADRLNRGTPPLAEALQIGKEIANALEAAHEKGILHRDLKPANIKITPEGQVKVLDFGLAKIFTEDAANTPLSQSPTLMSAASTPGMILGTAAYMSPEQARGKPADKRADVWAFGVVLFEMFTGRPAFEGETITDVLGAIVHKEPDWERLPAGTPAAAVRLLRRCLAKDARQRLHDIADARLEIEAALNEPAPEPAASRRSLQWFAAAALGIATVAFASGMFWTKFRGRVTPDLSTMPSVFATHTTIDLPSNSLLALGAQRAAVGFESTAVALSPDGKYLAYIGQAGSDTLLYLRALADTRVRPVAGTEGAIFAFFSPDNQWLGFLTNDKLKKIPLNGGAPVTLCDARLAVRAWWTRNDTIHFSADEGLRLYQVSAGGGRPSEVVHGHDLGVFTDVLPDGSVLAEQQTGGISKDYNEVVLSSAKQQVKTLIRSGYGARYVPPGYLVYGRAGNLFAVRFDLVRLEVQGDSIPIAAGVSMESLFGLVQAAFSSNGFLVYAPGGDRAAGRLAWVDRKGQVELVDAPAKLYGVVDLAPNGRRFAVQVADVTDYIWIYDLDRREGRRLTAAEGNGWPVWTPDGRQIAYSSFTGLRHRILVRGIDEAADVREITSGSNIFLAPSSWSPDGRILGLDRIEKRINMGLAGPDGKTEWLPDVEFERWGQVFSPDGRWIAYGSSESGQSEIWIRSFPDGKTVRQVSVNGGIEPFWCRCGELFYRNANHWTSVRISTQPELRWESPRLAFETDFVDTPGRSYAISPDGQRLLVVQRATPDVQNKLHVVTNWFASDASTRPQHPSTP